MHRPTRRSRHIDSRRIRHIDNVIAVLDQYIAAGIDLHHTMEALLERLDWTKIDPSAIKQAIRTMLKTTTMVELRDISNEADNERGILRNHLVDDAADEVLRKASRRKAGLWLELVAKA